MVYCSEKMLNIFLEKICLNDCDEKKFMFNIFLSICFISVIKCVLKITNKFKGR